MRDADASLWAGYTLHQRHMAVSSRRSRIKAWRPGVVSRDRALRHIGKRMAVPQRDVIPCRLANFRSVDRRGALRRHVIWHEKAMAKRHMPGIALATRHPRQRLICRF